MNAMTRRHLLGEAVFDVAFASEEEAFAQHLELGSLVRQRLLAVVDEVFDEVAGGGLVYRFDAIEIDLGELPPGDYREAMAQRLRERLRAHLLARLPARHAEPTPGVRAVSQRRLELEQLEHFLTRGRLPWNSRHEAVDTLERRAWEVLRASGAEFLEFLKSQSRAGEGVTRRLIAQFPDALLLEIAGRLAPTQPSLIAALAGEFGRVAAANQLTPARARELRQSVWSALLDGLLQTDGRAVSASGMIAAMLERMAQRAGGRAPGAEKAQGGAAKTALESFTAGINALLATGTAPSPLPSEERSEDAALEAVLLTGSDREIESAWRNALRRHPDRLREALRRHGANALVRARLAGILPESLLLETVDHLEPEGGGFVAVVIGQAGLFRALLDVAGGDQAGHRQRLWAFTLGYLAVERGTEFSRKAYLDSLIRQSAAHTALSRREGVARLQQALAQGEASAPSPAGLDSLLSELADAPPPPAPDAEMRSREQMRGYDLLDQLRAGLRGELEADTDLSAAVAELAEFHSLPWSQLHRELRSGAFPGASLGAGLAPETLGRLITGHLAYRGLSGRDGGVEHLAAIERRATRAADRARYYRQVLLGLVSSRSADLEPEYPLRSGADAEAETETTWVGVEEPPGKDGSGDELEGRLAPSASQATAGWKKETLQRLVDRLPGGPHSRIRLWLRSAGARAAPAPGRRVHGDLAGSIGAGSETDAAEQFVTVLERRAAAWQAHAADDLGMTSIPRRNAGADGSAETPLAAASAAPMALPEIESLLASLKQGPVTGAVQISALSRDIQVLLEAEPDRLEALLAELRRHGVALERLVAALPERLLTRLLFRLRGAEHHEIQACADTLAGACGFSDLGAEPARLHDAKWRFILGEWLGQGLLFERRSFVRQFAHTLAEQAGWPDQRRFRFLLRQQLGHELSHTQRSTPAREATGSPDVSPGHQAHEQAEVENAGTRPDLLRPIELHDAGPQPGQRPSATQALFDNREIILAVRAALEDRDAVPARPVKVVRESAEESGEDIYIDNAGLVLAAPYLPRLFAMLDLLDGPAFRDAAAAERAVRLLQYLVDGEESVDEFKLVLNKILCGLATDTPIEREAGFSEREKAAAEGLLRGMIDNWKGIGHTSVAGLRETFLRREGRLRLKDGAWNLLVAPKPFDMLLDTLPWSIAVIRHRWMDRVIHVAWR